MEEVGAGPYKEVFLAMYVETYNSRLGRCGVTVLDIGLRVVCNDKDGCVSRLEAVGSDYRGFSFQRFPGT